MRRVAVILIMIAMLLTVAEAGAERRKTTRGNISRRTPVENVPQQPVDTFLIPDSSEVRLFGYDKPLRSRRESFFVTNNTDIDINAISLTTLYFDSHGRQFHRAVRRLPVSLPPGETRRVDCPSWDTQQTFYFVGSKRSRSSGTPYTVQQSVDTIFFPLAEKETSK